MNIQRLRNLTTGRLHTQIEHVTGGDFSLHQLDGRRGRACNVEWWRVDEWCLKRECWWTIGAHDSYAKAWKQVDYCTKTCAAPGRLCRVVWIRERVQLLSAESPIKKVHQRMVRRFCVYCNRDDRTLWAFDNGEEHCAPCGMRHGVAFFDPRRDRPSYSPNVLMIRREKDD